MVSEPSCIFLTTPTSGTGSLWRLITALAAGRWKLQKIAEEHFTSGRGGDLQHWKPEPTGHIYMYNTPHVFNPAILDPAIRLIVNFRDPRDLACNQYHWALQHPVTDKTPEEVEAFRSKVRDMGINQYVMTVDNNIHFNSIRKLTARFGSDKDNLLVLSYNQLCVGFDSLVERLAQFLGTDLAAVPKTLIERERTDNLTNNPAWIGQQWTGSDTTPARYRGELAPDTIQKLEDRYRDTLRLLRSLELPTFRHYLATEQERQQMEQVVVGKGGHLFLTKDANNVVAQVEGKIKLGDRAIYRIALSHNARRLFGAMIGGFSYDHAIIPNKESVLKSYLPDSIKFEAEGPRPIAQYVESGAPAIWHPFYDPALLQPADDLEYYPRTDTHWNHDGAVRYLKGFLADRFPGYAPALEGIPLRRFASKQQGDLGVKLAMPPDDIMIIAPVKSSARLVFANEIPNEGSVRWFENPGAPVKEKLLIMHDSFAAWLLGIIPEIFQEVLFIHTTLFDYEFAKALKPTLVFCLQVERFFVRVPADDSSLMNFIQTEEKNKNAKASFIDYCQTRGIAVSL